LAQFLRLSFTALRAPVVIAPLFAGFVFVGVGDCVGDLDGAGVGDSVGDSVGDADGAGVGDSVGVSVGDAVTVVSASFENFEATKSFAELKPLLI
jgi:hypothetical protein